MRPVRLALLLAAIAVIAGLAWIRLAPSDPARWHVDPMTASDPGPAGVLYRPGGARAAPVYAAGPRDLLAALDRVAIASPRTRRLAGAPQDGRVTWLTRSRWIGFPDYTSVAALPAGDGRATLAIYARLRFGGSDLGVNRARVDAWLAALQPLEAVDQ